MKKTLHLLLGLLPPSLRQGLIDGYRRLRDQLSLIAAYRYDWQIYRRHSGLFRPGDAGVLEARLIKAYHRVEKGMSLAQPRPGFGKDAVQQILSEVRQYLDHFGASPTTCRALNTLREYVNFNQRHHTDVSWLEPELEALMQRSTGETGIGGTRRVRRDDILKAASIDLKTFFEHRHSVRQFSGAPVEDEVIRQAVLMAKKSPSVCNREPGCVFVATAAETKAALLALQNGNRGFGEQADRVLLITSRLDAFLTVGERYQSWIDGGLFAMSLIYALHSLGVASCCLNWSVEPDSDRALRKIAGVPADHHVIMMLAIGRLPEELPVAQSPRRPLEQVLHFI